MGLIIKAHAVVTRPACSQMQQYDPESSTKESFKVGNIDSGKFSTLIVKKSLALFPMCMSETEDNSSTFRDLPSLCFDFPDGLYRLYCSVLSQCTVQFIPV